jgi:hypothetical protein
LIPRCKLNEESSLSSNTKSDIVMDKVICLSLLFFSKFR